jgi:hypothetical protein
MQEGAAGTYLEAEHKAHEPSRQVSTYARVRLLVEEIPSAWPSRPQLHE